MTGRASRQKVIRVFPRRTNATPTDEYAFTGPLPLFWPEADEVHISVAFTYDLDRAEELAESWKWSGLPIFMGGPATGEPGGDFTPSLYLKPGCVITSRGCPNHCWFCSVWKREGNVRELPITEGWNVMDDNLLACSEPHIRAVFTMLREQRHPVKFTGGFEAARLKPWHIEELLTLRSPTVYFAYDTPDDLEPLRSAVRDMRDMGMSLAGHRVLAYVLIGYPGDSKNEAIFRLERVAKMGVMPFAMLYRDEKGKVDKEWQRLQRSWCRPAAIAGRI
jgi:hypothetical protein